MRSSKMTPTQTETPLRRSEVPRTPIVSVIENDDEAERRASRARVSVAESPSLSVMEHHDEGLKNCLKIFNENKITKNNAWTMSLIDNFSALINKHHKSLNSFQIVGSTLEASSKIYGLRVDSVHTDVLRMTSGLGRTKQTNAHDESMGGEEGAAGDNDASAQTADNEDRSGQPKVPKKKRRKNVSTITKNKESINGKLDTYPIVDATFAKLNSVVGDINSSNRLLLFTIPTDVSELQMVNDARFWNGAESQDIELVDEHDYQQTKPIRLPFNLGTSSIDKIRPELSGYKILDTPADDDSKDDSIADKSFDASQLDVAFDIDADLEPINDNNDFVDVDFDQNEMESLTVDDRRALENCRLLRRSATMLEDLRPTDVRSTLLEYSYRPLDNINQFWAGPSWWKFKKPRPKLTMSARLLGRLPPRKKALKNRYEEIGFVEDEEALNSLIDTNSKGAKKLTKANSYKKWDAKRFKLPTDLHLDRHRFNKYSFASGLPIETHIPVAVITENLNDAEDINGKQDEGHFDDGGHHFGNEDHHSIADADDNINSQIPCTNPETNITVTEIATEFAGAPEKVEKIDIQFAKRAKVIDMKQLKKAGMAIIEKQCSVTSRQENLPLENVARQLKYLGGHASFSKIYETLPSLLSKNMKEALSPAVAFYSILHLANEHRLDLLPDGEGGFIIRKCANDD